MFGTPAGAKSQALVVVGEAGCGKSVFCTRGSQRSLAGERNEFVPVLYLTTEDLDATRISDLSFSFCASSQAWIDAMAWILQRWERNWADDTQPSLYNAITTLQVRRNEWATMILDELVNDHTPKLFQRFMVERKERGNLRPMENLVVVVDEIGAIRAFSRGLVDCHRSMLFDKFVHSGICKKCYLILTGTELDPLGEPYWSGGTDPGKYVVATLERSDRGGLPDDSA
mmetsp:Transcript_21004/g.59935  ORF Transcript_21004/g.59935 Transcript_21004/m.59935 type:complete len:228 (+) Transcript_21004:2228-2911(+)